MKNLLLLLFTTFSSNLFCDYNYKVQYIGVCYNFNFSDIESLLPNKIIEAVSSTNFNKIADLVQNTLINNEFKDHLIKEAQKRVDHYKDASSSIFSSPKDSENFILSVLAVAGCFKAMSYCWKGYEPLELSTLVPKTLNTIYKQIEFDMQHQLQPDKIMSIIINKVFFNVENQSITDSQILAQEQKMKDAWFEIEKTKLIYSTSIIIAAQISIYSFYKMISALACSSANKKFKEAQTIFVLVNSWGTIKA